MQRTFLFIVIVLIATAVSDALGAPPDLKEPGPRLVRLKSTGKRSLISEISLSPHGDYLAVDWRDYNDGDNFSESVQIYETSTGKLLPPLAIKAFEIGASFTPAGNLFVGTADETSNQMSQIRDFPSGKDLFTFPAEQSVYCFSNDGRYALLGERGAGQYSFVLFDLKTKMVVSRAVPARDRLQFGGFSHPCLSADRKYFACTQDDWLYAWDMVNGKELLRQRRAGNFYFTCLEILSDSVSLRVAQADGTITTYDMPKGQEESRVRAVIEDTESPMPLMKFNSLGKQLLLGQQGRIRLWSAETGNYLGSFVHGPTNASIAYLRQMTDGYVAVNVDGTRETKEILVTHLPSIDRLSRK